MKMKRVLSYINPYTGVKGWIYESERGYYTIEDGCILYLCHMWEDPLLALSYRFF